MAHIGVRAHYSRILLVSIYVNKKLRIKIHLGDRAMDGRRSQTSIIVDLFRRERRHSIDSTAICLSDIGPFMELVRLGVPEVCFSTHAGSHVFQTVREIVD